MYPLAGLSQKKLRALFCACPLCPSIIMMVQNPRRISKLTLLRCFESSGNCWPSKQNKTKRQEQQKKLGNKDIVVELCLLSMAWLLSSWNRDSYYLHGTLTRSSLLPFHSQVAHGFPPFNNCSREDSLSYSCPGVTHASVDNPSPMPLKVTPIKYMSLPS